MVRTGRLAVGCYADRHKAACGACGVLGFCIVMTISIALPAREAPPTTCPAKSGANWLRHYTTACDSLRADARECRLCHTTIEQLNPYGLDLAEVGNLPWLIEDLDSDGDGRSNGLEISECTRPGVFDPVLSGQAEGWGDLKVRWR